MTISLKQTAWAWRGVLLVAPTITGLLVLLRWFGCLQLLELAALDQLFRLRPPEPPDPRIVIVGIQESDIQQLQQWPPSDAVIAQVVQTLKQQQPAAIGLTLYRDFPIAPGHQTLQQVFATTPNLIGVEKRIGTNAHLPIQPPPLLQQLQQVGISDLVLDPDGKVRRSLLFLTEPQQGVAISLGLRLALLYLSQRQVFPQIHDQRLYLGQTELTPLGGEDGGYTGIDAGGYQMLLNFRHSHRPSFETVSLMAVLDGRVPPNWATGRVVLIGAIAPSLNDTYLTPYSRTQPMAGVEIHAQTISQVISAALEGRVLLRLWNQSWEALWVGLWTLAGTLVAWCGRYRGLVWRQVTWIGLLAGALVGVTGLVFLMGWWLPVVSPLLGLTGGAIAVTVLTARSATRMRQTLGRYVSDPVVASLLETPDGLTLGGKRQQVTVLMADLRGFASSAERVPPEQVVTFLNRYLEIMTEVISHYQGTINEFLGDGILVIFGAPSAQVDDAERAIACALAMQQAMESVNQSRGLLELAVVEMGIGIHTGEGIVGNIGSMKRAKYGVVGSVINLAARIEAQTTGGQILISEATRQSLSAELTIRSQRQVRLKGFHQPVTLWEVQALGYPFYLTLPPTPATAEYWPVSITVQYTLLDGKSLRPEILQGTLTQLSPQGAELESLSIVPPGTPLKLDLLLTPTRLVTPEDLYAQVVQVDYAASRYQLRFNALSAATAALLRELRSL